MKKLFRRPSPAMVVALVALIVALAGTAVAGGVLNKKKVNKIVTNRAPGLSVASAKIADSARNVTDVASAKVNADGTVAAGTSGISVARASTGDYCISTPFQPTGATATIDVNAAFFPLAYVDVPADPTDCGATGKTSAEVVTFVSNPFGSTPVIHDEPFYVVVR